MSRVLLLRIDVLSDPEHTRTRANRGDFTPPGFANVGPAEASFDATKIELRIQEADPEEAELWTVSPAGQLRRDFPLLPPPRGVVY